VKKFNSSLCSSLIEMALLGSLLTLPLNGCEPSKPEQSSPSVPKKVTPDASVTETAPMSTPDPPPPAPVKKVIVTREACPKGSQLKGGVPPKDTELWCEMGGQRHGAYTRWHDSGKIAEQVTYLSGKQEGPSAQWDPEGRILEEGSYRSGQRSGRWKTYRDGRLNFEGDFKDGVQHGIFRNFAGNGVKQGEGQFRDGKPCGSFKCWAWETGDATSCVPLEQAPGCELTDTGAKCAPCADSPQPPQ